jgi:hypothetical protein
MLKKQNKIGFRDTHHCTPWVHVAFTFSAVNMFWVFVFLGGGGRRRRKTNGKQSIAKRSRTTNKVQGGHHPTTDVLGVFAAF